jgi:hypothetical protein
MVVLSYLPCPLGVSPDEWKTPPFDILAYLEADSHAKVITDETFPVKHERLYDINDYIDIVDYPVEYELPSLLRNLEIGDFYDVLLEHVHRHLVDNLGNRWRLLSTQTDFWNHVYDWNESEQVWGLLKAGDSGIFAPYFRLKSFVPNAPCSPLFINKEHWELVETQCGNIDYFLSNLLAMGTFLTPDTYVDKSSTVEKPFKFY